MRRISMLWKRSFAKRRAMCVRLSSTSLARRLPSRETDPLAGTLQVSGADQRLRPLTIYAGRIEIREVSWEAVVNALARAHAVALRCSYGRSEERRVGKEGVSTCRSRW